MGRRIITQKQTSAQREKEREIKRKRELQVNNICMLYTLLAKERRNQIHGSQGEKEIEERRDREQETQVGVAFLQEHIFPYIIFIEDLEEREADRRKRRYFFAMVCLLR